MTRSGYLTLTLQDVTSSAVILLSTDLAAPSEDLSRESFSSLCLSPAWLVAEDGQGGAQPPHPLHEVLLADLLSHPLQLLSGRLHLHHQQVDVQHVGQYEEAGEAGDQGLGGPHHHAPLGGTAGVQGELSGGEDEGVAVASDIPHDGENVMFGLTVLLSDDLALLYKVSC